MPLPTLNPTLRDVCGNGGGGRAGVCPFHDDPVEAARQALQERVLAQPLAIESLSMALSAWHYGYAHLCLLYFDTTLRHGLRDQDFPQ